MKLCVSIDNHKASGQAFFLSLKSLEGMVHVFMLDQEAVES